LEFSCLPFVDWPSSCRTRSWRCCALLWHLRRCRWPFKILLFTCFRL
jgi:hypothetical protein